MTLQTQLKHLSLIIGATMLAACGDATTQIIEKDPIVVPGDGDDHDHGDVSSAGRLLVTSKGSNQVTLFELEDNSLLASIGLTFEPAYLYASPSKRYAMLVQRNDNQVEFIDGGLWQEDHGDHLHPYQQAPALMDFSLNGSRPTHVTVGASQVAVFFDGDGQNGVNASAAMFDEMHIGSDNNDYPIQEFDTHMHGAAQARGENLFATLRDANSATTLPDRIARFHAHGDHFHQEETYEVICPVLHGSAQNHDAVAFACGDGVVVITEQDGQFSASKIVNSADFTEGMRIGSLRAHLAGEQFFGIAGSQVFVINHEAGEMEKLDWQPHEGATLLAMELSLDGETLVILDSQGYLSLLQAHAHDNELHWELAHKLDISEADVADMPEGSRFEMTLSGEQVFVASPIEKHILSVDLHDATISTELELDFVPQKLTWLGIVGEVADAHDH
ncbi:YncE family protein [Bowmanella denitrificans]|uniref:YncE family protein n=1 Tax=Bowmanella denitrificans TaxID=366582 RepID=UPI000C99FD0F|nr:5-methyltetrahydrofolate--homocysteine methyltransferase [Bowmanella denitrificans]